MNSMKMLLIRSVNFVKNRTAVLVFAGFMLAPAAAFSQVDQEEEGGYNDPQLEISTAPGGEGPWQNSAGSAIGSSDNFSSTTPRTTAPAGTPHLSRPNATLDRDPGGNPDVPFDDNMNLAFLAGGLLFAFIVVRKRWNLKPASINTKQ